MDQVQQNFITPRNHKETFGAILAGNFRNWDKINKTRLENKGMGSKFAINQGS